MLAQLMRTMRACGALLFTSPSADMLLTSRQHRNLCLCEGQSYGIVNSNRSQIHTSTSYLRILSFESIISSPVFVGVDSAGMNGTETGRSSGRIRGGESL